jgi:DNA repair protein RadC
VDKAFQPDLFATVPTSVQEASADLSLGRTDPVGGSLEALRLRAADLGPRILDEPEALALLLERCTGVGDPTQAADALLARFGCVARILGATIPELGRVVGSAAAVDLKLAHELLLRALEFEVRRRPLLGSWSAVTAYLRAKLGGRSREAFHVLFLDKANQLIADEPMGDGTVDHAPVYPREIMRRALELAAPACLLVHNHPSGGSMPSRADIDMTREVIEAGQVIGVTIHDHFLVAGDQVVSFRGLGLI